MIREESLFMSESAGAMRQAQCLCTLGVQRVTIVPPLMTMTLIIKSVRQVMSIGRSKKEGANLERAHNGTM